MEFRVQKQGLGLAFDEPAKVTETVEFGEALRRNPHSAGDAGALL